MDTFRLQRLVSLLCGDNGSRNILGIPPDRFDNTSLSGQFLVVLLIQPDQKKVDVVSKIFMVIYPPSSAKFIHLEQPMHLRIDLLYPSGKSIESKSAMENQPYSVCSSLILILLVSSQKHK